MEVWKQLSFLEKLDVINDIDMEQTDTTKKYGLSQSANETS